MGRHLTLSDFKGIGAVVSWSDDAGATWHPTVFDDVVCDGQVGSRVCAGAIRPHFSVPECAI